MHTSFLLAMSAQLAPLYAELPFSISAPWVMPALAVIASLVIGLLIRSTSKTSGRPMRITAALLLSVAVMLGCKYGIVSQALSAAQEVKPFQVENVDAMISLIANEVKAEWRNAGQSVPGTARSDDPTAPIKEQYNPKLWAEATSRWEALSPEEQLKRVDDHQRSVNEIWALDAMNKEKTLDWPTFQKSFVPLDAAWLAIAAVLAMIIAGSGRTTIATAENTTTAAP